MIWSIGWLVVSLLAAVVVLVLSNEDDAVTYTTVYFIERSLSLDNLFVFILLFSYFGVPEEHRARLLFWGIVAALVLRGLAILGGVALIEQFHFVIYVLGVLLLVLAYRILRGVAENVDPDKNFIVRLVRRFFPVTSEYHERALVRAHEDDKRYVTPLFLCLAAIVAADIAFAVDSIPAAFAITRDSVLIWMGNVFALLGMRALFVLVEGLIRRFRYLDETIAVRPRARRRQAADRGPLQDRPGARRCGIVAACFAIGITRVADRRPPRPGRGREAGRAPPGAQRGRRRRPGAGGDAVGAQYSSGPGRGSSSSSSSTSSSSSSSSGWPARTALTSRRSSSSSRCASSSGTSSPTRIQSPSSMSSASSAPGWAESSTTIRISVSGLK